MPHPSASFAYAVVRAARSPSARLDRVLSTCTRRGTSTLPRAAADEGTGLCHGTRGPMTCPHGFPLCCATQRGATMNGCCSRRWTLRKPKPSIPRAVSTWNPPSDTVHAFTHAAGHNDARNRTVDEAPQERGSCGEQDKWAVPRDGGLACTSTAQSRTSSGTSPAGSHTPPPRRQHSATRTCSLAAR
jgi:hypothetical protein